MDDAKDRYSMLYGRQLTGRYRHLNQKELRQNTLRLLREDDDVISMLETEVCGICTDCIHRHKYGLLRIVLLRTGQILTEGSISLIEMSCFVSADMLALECVLDTLPKAKSCVGKFYYMCGNKEIFDYVLSLDQPLEEVSTAMFIRLVNHRRSCPEVLKSILNHRLTPKETIERGVENLRCRSRRDEMMDMLFLCYCTDNV